MKDCEEAKRALRKCEKLLVSWQGLRRTLRRGEQQVTTSSQTATLKQSPPPYPGPEENALKAGLSADKTPAPRGILTLCT